MASLVKLPVETLQRVCHFLAHFNTKSVRNLCLVNKTFHQICSPYQIYQWGNSEEGPDPPLEAFVLHLFKHPELRKKVRSLTIGWESIPRGSDHSVVDLDRQILSELAEAAASDMKINPEYLTPLCAAIERGHTDAINSLLLAWCTGLTHLEITVSRRFLWDGRHSHVLTFAKEAVVRLLCGQAPAVGLALRELRHLRLHQFRESGHVFFAAATPFFHLPKIKSIWAFGLCDNSSILEEWSSGTFDPFGGDYGSRYALAVPDALSSLNELVLYSAGLKRDGLSRLLLGVRSLKKLTVKKSITHGCKKPDPKEIADTLKICKDSLEEIDLENKSPEYFVDPDSLALDCDILANEMLVEKDLYGDFVKLRRLSLPMMDLLSVSSDDERKRTPGKLPESIEYLKPRCLDMVESWVNGDSSVEPYVKAFIRILEEAGTGHRLCNLKVLDLSDTFVDDPETFGITRLKDMANSRNVKLLLN